MMSKIVRGVISIIVLLGGNNLDQVSYTLKNTELKVISRSFEVVSMSLEFSNVLYFCKLLGGQIS